MVVVIILTLLISVEIYYWFIYFPKAWKEGSNREIEDIKYILNSDI